MEVGTAWLFMPLHPSPKFSQYPHGYPQPLRWSSTAKRHASGTSWMSQIDPTPPFRSPDGTLESRRRASLMSRALTDQKYQHTGPRAGCPRQSSTWRHGRLPESGPRAHLHGRAQGVRSAV